jgi:hypothetical protein
VGTSKQEMLIKFRASRVKSRVVPVHHEGVWGSGYIDPHFLDLRLVGGEWSDSGPGRFTPRERASGTHWIGG